MYNLLKSDVYKLKYSKELWISIAVVSIFGMINVMSSSALNGKYYLTREFTDWGSILGSTIFAGMFIGRDFSNRMIYHSVTIGKSRLSILMSKYLTYLMGCTGIILINLFISSVVYSQIHGWGQPFTKNELLFLLVYSMIHLILNLCILSFPFLIAILIKDTGIATALSGVSMGAIVTFSNTFWNGIANNLASGKFDVNTMIGLVGMLFIPFIALIIGLFVFYRQDL